MYSLLFVSLTKPIFKKYCEEHRTSDKVQKIFKMVLPKLSDITRVAPGMSWK
jgi:hypothetical protein